mmetsp:Transcript_27074/g.78123  ORF Transcript_27074/g.78123 Transcript_27074/m.78123 type:complete len:242 (-) Transcript_27074:1723-2448(-)
MVGLLLCIVVCLLLCCVIGLLFGSISSMGTALTTTLVASGISAIVREVFLTILLSLSLSLTVGLLFLGQAGRRFSALQIVSLDAVLWPAVRFEILKLVFSLPLSIGLLATCQAIGLKVVRIKVARVPVEIVVVIHSSTSSLPCVRIVVWVVVWVIIRITSLSTRRQAALLRFVKDIVYSQGTLDSIARSLDRFGRAQPSRKGLGALGGALHLGLDLIPQIIPGDHSSLVSLGNVLNFLGAE